MFKISLLLKKAISTKELFRAFLKSPARITIIGFACLITIGTLLLMLPQSSSARSIDIIDALFTSTSAVCVTGLTVVDTAADFTPFGQFIILFLIQFGGLGIMTMSTYFIMAIGTRPSFTSITAIQDSFSYSIGRSPVSILRDIALFTFVIEFAGVIILFFVFSTGHTFSRSLYLSIFHAISAFCNAGFSLFSDSFSAYINHWMLNATICVLIIFGGIGFPVLSEIKHHIASKRLSWARLSLHSKLVLSSTAILLFVSTLLILIMELQNTLSTLPIGNRIITAFFQAVNTRTSGFNTLPIGNMANETLFVLIIFMFIGASPGSCGGGIKTTTISSLFILGISRFRGQNRPSLFGRSISEKSIGKAVSVLLISALIVCIGLMILLTTELGDTPHPLSRGHFLDLFFEVVSAFGTVGLSTGLTSSLTNIGKLVITFTMFVGRLGPLVIAMAVSRPIVSKYHFAEENIIIG